jgi:three-Cys-motif partner protein
VVGLDNYAGREQAYVKHIFLERYLESLVFKTASAFDHIVYVDGFAGPWQSVNEQFEDTSFGIALSALRRAKAAWKLQHRDVKMTALLVERDPSAYARLAAIRARYPDILIKTYNADFISIVPRIVADIPADAFAFFLIDPKGWRISLVELQSLLARPNSEVTFNFMFEFINRAASMSDPAVIKGLDELMPHGDWRQRLRNAEEQTGRPVTSDDRKEILAAGFSESLKQIGGYQYVAETTVLRPLRDRPIYCLFYATRHERGIAVFRDCQVAALIEQSKARAMGKVQHKAHSSGQSELFDSLHDMGPDDTNALLERERMNAKATILELAPRRPQTIRYRELWPAVLSRHVVRLKDVNALCGAMKKTGELIFPTWGERKRVPDDAYPLHKA